ncbi:hypothetical protein ADL26_14610 [Thermoactinomyces vulgaris]|jgi:hypothetical protein|nr:hypothetical protein ADL26_14610 [Thermoactinomyces vulgaris]
MLGFYLIIAVLFLGGGLYQLFVAQLPVFAVHSFLVALYFYVTFYELRGKPFSRYVYLITIGLLVADGLVNLLLVSESILSGMVSVFFAFLCLQSYRRIYRKRA